MPDTPTSPPTSPTPAPYYVTTPIYYVNDRPHIGHAYTTLLGDILARAQRLVGGPGAPVFFLTGTDEHAEKVVKSAQEHGVSPMEWATLNADRFRDAFGLIGFTNDDFVRTTEDRHTSRASAYIKKLVDSGDIELGDYEGWYDPSQEEYVTETVAKEHEFKSPVTGRPLEKRVEQNYFFRLDKYEPWLREMIESGSIRIAPEQRKNEVLGRIRQGLQKVPVSRKIKDGDADWGVRMPGDDGHRVYVWIEALCNYLTVVDTPDRRSFWPTDGSDARIVHTMAKDILWFHAVVWPAMLHALGERPPEAVYAHAYWIAEGRKMSKSEGNFIEIDTLGAYAERYSLDAVRWFLATQGPSGAVDADFAHSRFVEVYNSELANGVGNAASRVSNMIEKYFGDSGGGGSTGRTCNGEFGLPGGRSLPILLAAREAAGKPVEDPGRSFDFAAACGQAVERAVAAYDELRIADALAEGTGLVRMVDDFISYSAPFTLAKRLDDHEHGDKALATMLYTCAEALRIASLLLWPAMPEKMESLWAGWGCEHRGERGFLAPLRELAAWTGDHSIAPDQTITKGDALFMRADPGDPPPSA